MVELDPQDYEDDLIQTTVLVDGSTTLPDGFTLQENTFSVSPVEVGVY